MQLYHTGRQSRDWGMSKILKLSLFNYSSTVYRKIKHVSIRFLVAFVYQFFTQEIGQSTFSLWPILI